MAHKMTFLVLLRKPRDKKNVTTMFQKSGGYMHTQIVLDFKFNLDVVARKDKFKKQISATQQKS